eukprot:g10813.t1
MRVAGVLAVAVHVDRAAGLSLPLPSTTSKHSYDACPLPAHGRWCTVHLANGASFPLAVYAHADIVSHDICGTGYWEQVDFSQYETPRGQVLDKAHNYALDVGANVGYFSFALAAYGWKKVIAFEPLPANIQLIQASLCANPDLAARIDLRTYGLGSAKDAGKQNCSFWSDAMNQGDGTVHCGPDATFPLARHAHYVKRGKFELRTLDDVLAGLLTSGGPGIDFVKLDVENHECEVLAGGKTLLTEFRPKLIETEVWPVAWSQGNCDPDKYLQLYEAAHYSLWKDAHCATVSHSAKRFAAETVAIGNYFACSMSSGEKLKAALLTSSASSAASAGQWGRQSGKGGNTGRGRRGSRVLLTAGSAKELDHDA